MAQNDLSTSPNLPVRISDTAGVRSVDFDLNYDPTLLSISGVLRSQALLDAGWSITINNNTPGVLHVTVSGVNALAAGAQDVVYVVASVPSTAPCGASEDLHFSNVHVNETNIAVRTDSAIHKATFLGDATGDGSLSGLDANFVSRYVVLLDGGFDRAALTDPRIVADVTGDGTLSGLDASTIAHKIVDSPAVSQIPDFPAALPSTIAAVDPTIGIPLNVIGTRGGSVNVPVSVTDDASGMLSADLTISYDPTLVSISDSDISLSSYLVAQGWSYVEHIDATAGTIKFTLSSGTGALPAGMPQLLNLNFHIAADAPAGTSALHFEDLAGHPDRLNEGQLSLTAVDGSIRIPIDTSIQGAPASVVERTPVNNLTTNLVGAQGAVTYAWTVTKTHGSTVTTNYGTGTGSTFNFTPDVDGSYVVSVTVTDAQGNTGTDSKTVTVAVPTVAGRNVFYANSFYSDTTKGRSDGTAIALISRRCCRVAWRRSPTTRAMTRASTGS